MSRAFRPLVFAILAFLVFTVAGAAVADPIAVLVSLKGDVRVAPAKGRDVERAALGRALESGDEVRVGPKSSATVFFSAGNVIELSENSSVKVGGKLDAKGGGAELPSEVFIKSSKFITGGSSQTGLTMLAPMRGADEESESFLIAPRRTEVQTGRPRFSWREVKDATRYTITLSNDDGELWSREVQGPSLEYPADVEALEPDVDYLWEVQALSDRGPLRKEESYFRVLSSSEAKEVREHLDRIEKAVGGPESEAARYVAGSYLFGRGLFSDAATQFEALSTLAPRSPGPHEALGNVYRAVGLMDLAAAQFQRALSLSR